MKVIKIALKDLPKDYSKSLVPILIQALAYEIQWVDTDQADLIVQGPFFKIGNKPHRWIPKPIRPVIQKLQDKLTTHYVPIKNNSQLTLFHTSENIRPDCIKTNFALSFDLGIDDAHHFRLPYWMEMIDWSQEGVVGNLNPRYGRLLDLNRLMQPLGTDFLKRDRKALLISSHLFEPRKTLMEVLSKLIIVDGLGYYFDSDIKNHHQSGFNKFEKLQEVAFNLCPENGLYPGYYTEKIPEAFFAGCLPITWTDSNVQVDFNPKAMINLELMHWNHFVELSDLLLDDQRLKKFAEEPLILKKPSILPLLHFLKEVCQQATS